MAREFDPFHAIADWRSAEETAAAQAEAPNAADAPGSEPPNPVYREEQLSNPKHPSATNRADANEANLAVDSAKDRPDCSAPAKGGQQ
jgi:hypothetical protein